MKTRRSLALLIWVLTMAASAGAIVIVIATRDTPVPSSWGFRGASEAFAITCGTVGAIVALRRPDNRIGWLFCAIGAFFAAEAFVNEYVIAGTFVVAGSLPGTAALGWTLTWLWVPPLGIALIFLPLLFPSGRLLSPRWRAVVILGAVAIVAFSLALAFAPGPIEQATFLQNPLGVTGMDVGTYSNIVLGPIWLPLTAAIVLSLASLALRFRRAPTEERQQIKWFALATLVAGSVFAVYIAVSVSAPASTWKGLEILVIVSLMGLPTAAGMAILRYRLYDIDRIISRTLGYVILSAILFATFAVATVALESVISPLTGGESLAVAASTLLVAGLVAPIRSRVQRTVDRRFDRARYNTERTAVAFGERLRSQVDITALADDLGTTVRSAVAPTSVGLWLRDGISDR